MGEEEIDGVKAVHYATTMPIDAYLEQAEGSAPAAEVERLKEAGVKEVNSDFWLTEKYQIARMRVVMGRTELVVNYRDYGKPIDLAAPPVAETAKFSAFNKSK